MGGIEERFHFHIGLSTFKYLKDDGNNIMKVVVTAKVKLTDFSPLLDKVMRVNAQAVQFYIDTAWQHHIKHKTPLHANLYNELRERSDLHFQL